MKYTFWTTKRNAVPLGRPLTSQLDKTKRPPPLIDEGENPAGVKHRLNVRKKKIPFCLRTIWSQRKMDGLIFKSKMTHVEEKKLKTNLLSKTKTCCRCVFTNLEVLEGSAPVVTSVREAPESPEEQQKIPALLHPEMRVCITLAEQLQSTTGRVQVEGFYGGAVRSGGC